MVNQKDLERRQVEISEAMRTLKSEVKDEIRASLKNLNQFLPELPADLEAILERSEHLDGGLESLKENFPFALSEKLSPFEEKLRFSHVHIMVRACLSCCSLDFLKGPFGPHLPQRSSDRLEGGRRERRVGYDGGAQRLSDGSLFL